ncbi:hypothetical protein BDW74DRAFT_183536 [Aspergillus multicolor]|uniref:uncharacterized protein n=1 Tax=Aspergillus multicolor TaxID=41759 RepID=UPI003CCE4B07
MLDNPVRESIKVVDNDTWLIGPILLHRTARPLRYSNLVRPFGRNTSYEASKAADPLLAAVPLPPRDFTIALVHDVGDAYAVWLVGNSALLKVKIRVENVTPENMIITYVHSKNPSFDVPRVLYAAETEDRSYLFLTLVEGRTHADAWSTLGEGWRTHYVNSIANACKEMGSWKRDDENLRLGGVDGRGVREGYLNQIHQAGEPDFKPGTLLKNCQTIGLHGSQLVFCHLDLGPGTIIVENVPVTGSIRIIDWEIAGFFPRGWIRTKFRVSSGLDLPDIAGVDPKD